MSDRPCLFNGHPEDGEPETTMSNLIERLHKLYAIHGYESVKEALDALEAMQKEIERLRPCVHPKAWNQAQERIAELERALRPLYEHIVKIWPENAVVKQAGQALGEDECDHVWSDPSIDAPPVTCEKCGKPKVQTLGEDGAD